MHAMRLFTAVELPEPSRNHLAHLLETLRAHPMLQDVASFTPPQNLHITLKFIGDVPDDRVPLLVASLRTLAIPPMPFALERFLVLPGQGPARVLAVNVTKDLAPITSLFNQIESACQPLGVSREAREYKPHITLARFRRPTQRLTARTLIRMIDPSLLPAPAFTATHFTLFQSQLTPTGAIHTPLATFGS
jgi:2'-5' RNA ligase